MITQRFVALALIGVLSSPLAALGQIKGEPFRIGVLETTSMAMNTINFDAFRRGLRELGYVEGQNLIIEYRSADGRPERFGELANEVVRMKVDVIVTRGTPAAQAVKNATGTIPIVVAAFGDPVRSGLVKSLSHPGGNITGLNTFASEIWSKRVELIKETFPGIVRIGHLDNLSNPLVPPSRQEIETAARTVGARTQFFDVRKAQDLGPAFDAATRQRADALLVGIDTVPLANRKVIVELATKHRLPAIYAAREFVDAGGLMSYGVSYPQLYYRAANYVARILKGAKPGDLPVEQPTRLELVINLKAAKALGVSIPRIVLLRADEVVE
ncbi:MAG: ABC transporter substrate-binding protein [Betaproteobacteria bacterium]|nr:ABC transporter substrate-binding protein [Betaproteobacteria bacterium]